MGSSGTLGSNRDSCRADVTVEKAHLLVIFEQVAGPPPGRQRVSLAPGIDSGEWSIRTIQPEVLGVPWGLVVAVGAPLVCPDEILIPDHL